jgi:hypothetical protein
VRGIAAAATQNATFAELIERENEALEKLLADAGIEPDGSGQS